MFGKIKVTNFAKRHFDPKFGGTKITNKTPEEFEEYLNSRVDDSQTPNNGNQKFRVKIIDGYAPFCKLILIENFTDAKVGTMEITNENYQYLRFEYSKRRGGEIAYLKKFFDFPVKNNLPVAKNLFVVVYDREQLLKEHYADIEKGELCENIALNSFNFNADFGIVAILAQDECEEQPITPETMINNHMGIKFGGSGVELNVNEYEKSVLFWNNHAIVRS